jgi:hypothetical protein
MVGLYIADLAGKGRKVARISRRVVAIAQAHRIAGAQMDLKRTCRKLFPTSVRAT